MKLLDKLKESLKAASEKNKKRNELYEQAYEEEYNKQLVVKAKKDAYDKINKKKESNHIFGTGKIQIGMYGNDEEEKSAFTR